MEEAQQRQQNAMADGDGSSSDFSSAPAGSRFGEAGERLRSARARSARMAGGSSRPTSAVSIAGGTHVDEIYVL